jgi:hypothetical protein
VLEEAAPELPAAEPQPDLELADPPGSVELAAQPVDAEGESPILGRFLEET